MLSDIKKKKFLAGEKFGILILHWYFSDIARKKKKKKGEKGEKERQHFISIVKALSWQGKWNKIRKKKH